MKGKENELHKEKKNEKTTKKQRQDNLSCCFLRVFSLQYCWKAEWKIKIIYGGNRGKGEIGQKINAERRREVETDKENMKGK